MHKMIKERDLNYSACSHKLASYVQLNDELRKNVSMLESENDKLAKTYTHCSTRLTTCEESCQLYTHLCIAENVLKLCWVMLN